MLHLGGYICYIEMPDSRSLVPKDAGMKWFNSLKPRRDGAGIYVSHVLMLRRSLPLHGLPVLFQTLYSPLECCSGAMWRSTSARLTSFAGSKMQSRRTTSSSPLMPPIWWPPFPPRARSRPQPTQSMHLQVTAGASLCWATCLLPSYLHW